MNKPLKVLMIGSNLSTMIIIPLIEMLKTVAPATEVSTCGLFESGRRAVLDGEQDGSIQKCYSSTFGTVHTRSQKNSQTSKNFRRIHRIVNTASLLSHWQKFNNFDLVHLQGLFGGFHTSLFSARKLRVPLVVSCWGSDVLRTDRISIIKKQQRILCRANAVTVSSPEFREIVLAKYGRMLGEKIHQTQFSPTLKDVLRCDPQSSKREFYQQFGISTEKLLLCVGHNGTQECQHLPILQSLAKLERHEKDRLHLILPMTYGGRQSYLESVESLAKASGLTFTLLSEFIPDHQVAQLRHATDIFVYAPVSDAFSATVSQFIAANTICILGSWLPYKQRKRAGFEYWEIDAPGETSTVVSRITSNWREAENRVQNNRDISVDFFDPTKLGRQWFDAYRSAIENFQANL